MNRDSNRSTIMVSSVSILVVGMLLSALILGVMMKGDTKTITKTVIRGPVKYLPGAPEAVDHRAIGTMTRDEFNSITIGMDMALIRKTFGEPPGNVPDDSKTFFPAEGGGRYWIHVGQLNDGHIENKGGCNSDETCSDVVTKKNYER